MTGGWRPCGRPPDIRRIQRKAQMSQCLRCGGLTTETLLYEEADRDLRHVVEGRRCFSCGDISEELILSHRAWSGLLSSEASGEVSMEVKMDPKIDTITALQVQIEAAIPIVRETVESNEQYVTEAARGVSLLRMEKEVDLRFYGADDSGPLPSAKRAYEYIRDAHKRMKGLVKAERDYINAGCLAWKDKVRREAEAAELRLQAERDAEIARLSAERDSEVRRQLAEREAAEVLRANERRAEEEKIAELAALRGDPAPEPLPPDEPLPPLPSLPPIVLPPVVRVPVVAQIKIDGVQEVTTWKFEVLNLSLVPEVYLLPREINAVLVGQIVRAKKELAVEMLGGANAVRVYTVTGIRNRS